MLNAGTYYNLLHLKYCLVYITLGRGKLPTNRPGASNIPTVTTKLTSCIKIWINDLMFKFKNNFLYHNFQVMMRLCRILQEETTIYKCQELLTCIHQYHLSRIDYLIVINIMDYIGSGPTSYYRRISQVISTSHPALVVYCSK